MSKIRDEAVAKIKNCPVPKIRDVSGWFKCTGAPPFTISVRLTLVNARPVIHDSVASKRDIDGPD